MLKAVNMIYVSLYAAFKPYWRREGEGHGKLEENP